MLTNEQLLKMGNNFTRAVREVLEQDLERHLAMQRIEREIRLAQLNKLGPFGLLFLVCGVVLVPYLVDRLWDYYFRNPPRRDDENHVD